MIHLTTGKPAQGMSLDLRNPAQSTPARVGLAASPAQSAQGSTTQRRGSAHVGFLSAVDWLRIASIKPDSLIPSRIADFITQYATQSPIAVPIADITIAPKKNCIVPSVSKKSWPFTADGYFKREALEGAPLAGKVSGAVARSIPHGNHGDNLRSVQN